MNLNLAYRPPHGGWPQEIPNYYRFPNGTVRTDLRSLSHEELNSLGWTGPHEPPVRRQLDEVISVRGIYNEETHEFIPEEDIITEITSGWISKTKEGILSTAEFNPSTKILELPKDFFIESGELYFIESFTDAVEDYGYDPEIERWDWDDSLGQYVIINLREEEENRPVPPIDPPTPPIPPDWDLFKSTAITSVNLNTLLGELLTTAPILATAFPVTFLELENGKYSDFITIWNTINSVTQVSSELIEEFVSLSNQCNLPQEFINILNSPSP